MHNYLTDIIYLAANGNGNATGQAASTVCEVDPNKYWELVFYGFKFCILHGILWLITQTFYRI